jgi:peptidoglycan/xylan/chitin deacetylase (PgdA/CDA1 family)
VHRKILSIGTLLAVIIITAPSVAYADVAVTFDDGYQTQYDVARPELLHDHIPATFYIISGQLGPEHAHVTADEVRQLSVDGFNIGSHTVDHPHLTMLASTQVGWEFAQSKATLEAITGLPVTDFAFPYGDTTPWITASCLSVYKSCRGDGPTTSSKYGAVYVLSCASGIPLPKVLGWIDGGRSPNVLVVLNYHSLAYPVSDPYSTTPRRFRRAMRYLASSGIKIVATGWGSDA